MSKWWKRQFIKSDVKKAFRKIGFKNGDSKNMLRTGSVDELNYLAALIKKMNRYDFDMFRLAVAATPPVSLKDTINIAAGIDCYFLDKHPYESDKLHSSEYKILPLPGRLKKHGFVIFERAAYSPAYDGKPENIPSQFRISLKSPPPEMPEQTQPVLLEMPKAKENPLPDFSRMFNKPTRYQNNNDCPLEVSIAILNFKGESGIHASGIKLPTTLEKMQNLYSYVGVNFAAHDKVMTRVESFVQGLEICDLGGQLDEMNYLAHLIEGMKDYQYDQFQSIMPAIKPHQLTKMINVAANIDCYFMLDDLPDDKYDSSEYEVKHLIDENGEDVFLILEAAAYSPVYFGDPKTIPQEFRLSHKVLANEINEIIEPKHVREKQLGKSQTHEQVRKKGLER